MSQLERAKENRQKSTNKRTSSPKYPNMMTFHPTTQEKEVLATLGVDLEKALELLSGVMEAHNCTLTMGCRLDSGTFYATIRQKTNNWETAPSLSSWHSKPEKALMGLYIALQDRYNEFPEIEGSTSDFKDEW